MGRGQGAFIRIQNKSSQTVDVKVIEGRKIEDMGLEKLEGSLEAGQQFPTEGKQRFNGIYGYIKGEVKNRFQKDGYFSVQAHPSDGSPESKLTLVVDHNSWEVKDTSPDNDSSVVLVADLQESEEDDFKIELRIYDNFNPAKWMEEYGEKHNLGAKALSCVGLPGTHDSGTYQFDKDKGASPDSELGKVEDILDRGRMLGKLNDWILQQVFERLCQCQSLTIREQLEKGIRYLDLRVAYHPESDSFSTCHGVFCVSMEEILQEIQDFMNENPKEIVIIEFKKLYGFEEAQHETLTGLIFDMLGEKLALKNECPPSATVQEYWDKGFQAIVLYKNNASVQTSEHRLWPLHKLHSPWPNVSDTKGLHAELKEEVEKRDPQRFFAAQGILTPNADAIKRQIMDGDGLSIKKMASDCSTVIIDWVEDEWKPSNQVNIVLVDFSEIGNIVPSVINYNHS